MVIVSGKMELTLTLLKGSDELDQRVLVFAVQGATIRVGRASPTPSKQLQPARDNCCIKNSVVSRDHATFSLGTDHDGTAGSGSVPKLALFLADGASRHGTCINGKQIRGKGKVQLRSLDEIQFGGVVPTNKEPYEPPLFRVQIRAFHDEPKVDSPATKPLRFTLPNMTPGRAFTVPDDYNDDSELSESSGSECDLKQSHSSPVSTPPDVVQNLQAMQEIMFDKEKEMLDFVDTSVVEKESSQGFVPDKHASQTDMFQPHEDDEESQVHLPSYEDLESYFTGDEEEIDGGAKTPDGTPHISFWQSKDLSHRQLASSGPLSNVTLPPPLTGKSLLSGGSVLVDGYTDGPFAKATPNHSVDFDDDFDEMMPQINRDDYSRPWLHEHKGENRKASTITKTTQEFLDSTQFSDTKNDMSISSLMNPEISVKSNKRKAAQFEQDDTSVMEAAGNGELAHVKSHVKYADAATEIAERDYSIGYTSAESAVQTPSSEFEIMKIMDASTQPMAEPRPSKRLRTIITHTGTFALGAVSLLAGLMALPDNYFA